jgi:hypothetical protein
MDEPEFQRHVHPHLWRCSGRALSVALLGGLLVCALSLLVIQRGILTPPNFTVGAGSVELSAPCPANGDYCPPSPPHYSIWLMVRRPGAYTVDLYQLVTFIIDRPASTHAPAGAADHAPW